MNKEINGVKYDESQFFDYIVGTTPEQVLTTLMRLQDFYELWDAERFDDGNHHRILNILCKEQWLRLENNTTKSIFIHKDSTSGAKFIPPSASRIVISNYNHIVMENHNENIVLKVM